MSAMKEVSEEIRKALDELPVHSQQLFHMFRKHGNKTSRTRADFDATDRRAIGLAEDAKWKGDWTPNDVVDAGKNDRPDPEDYLDSDYIKNHLDQFRDGASRIYRTDSLHEWGPGNRGTTFVFPTESLDEVLKEADGSSVKLAELLGLDKDFFKNPDGSPADIQIRHFEPHELDGLRVPSGNEGGAGDDWIPGGVLPTGIPEAVIDIPGGATGWNEHSGGHDMTAWPGTANSYTLKS